MEERLLDLLEDICGDEVVKENPDIDLIEEDLMDSLDYTELLIAIEENFNVVIAPSEVTREQMSTPNKIIAQIKSRM
jgi:D-alanine--poly(phosphoribitol) ligase subunit 2